MFFRLNPQQRYKVFPRHLYPYPTFYILLAKSGVFSKKAWNRADILSVSGSTSVIMPY